MLRQFYRTMPRICHSRPLETTLDRTCLCSGILVERPACTQTAYPMLIVISGNCVKVNVNHRLEKHSLQFACIRAMLPSHASKPCFQAGQHTIRLLFGSPIKVALRTRGTRFPPRQRFRVSHFSVKMGSPASASLPRRFHSHGKVCNAIRLRFSLHITRGFRRKPPLVFRGTRALSAARRKILAKGKQPVQMTRQPNAHMTLDEVNLSPPENPNHPSLFLTAVAKWQLHLCHRQDHSFRRGPC